MDSPRVVVRVKRLPHGASLPLPSYESEWAAGMDLRAALSGPLVIPAGEWRAVPTGIVLELPEGYEGQVRPRSGLAATSGLTVLNSPGTIDADYRGEVKVLLVNLGRAEQVVAPGMRVAQLVVAPVARVRLVEAEEVSATGRGEGGFGHTGR